MALTQELSKPQSVGHIHPLPVFIKEVLLEHNQVHSFMYRLGRHPTAAYQEVAIETL